MQKITPFLRNKYVVARARGVFFAMLFVFISIANASAAGFSCGTKIKYTSCNPGYYLSDCGTRTDGGTVEANVGNDCYECPANCTCEGGAHCPKLSAKSVTCDPGQYIEKGKTDCSACKAGYYCSGGTYSIAASGAASDTGINACEAGTYQDKTGQTSCIKCCYGSYQNQKGQTNCIACKDGKTNTGTGNTTCGVSCVTTNVAEWKNSSWSTDNTVLYPCQVKSCQPGSYFNGSSPQNSNQYGSCIPCTEGYYMTSDKHTNISCTKCGKGTYQDTTGQSSCTNCTKMDGWGEWLDWGTTNPISDSCPFNCEANHSKDEKKRLCVECNPNATCPGSYKVKNGQSSYDACSTTPEASCEITCNDGTYVKDAYGSCVSVGDKQYASKHTVDYGKTSTDQVKNCPDGADGSNKISISSCYKKCSKGEVSDKGNAITNGGGYIYYSQSTNSYSNKQCFYDPNCPARTRANMAQSTSNPASIECISCIEGTYSEGRTSTSCNKCINIPENATATSNASKVDGCLWRCNETYYKNNDGKCELCPGADEYSNFVTSSIERDGSGYKNDTITGCYLNISPDTEFLDETGVFTITDPKQCMPVTQ